MRYIFLRFLLEGQLLHFVFMLEIPNKLYQSVFLRTTRISICLYLFFYLTSSKFIILAFLPFTRCFWRFLIVNSAKQLGKRWDIEEVMMINFLMGLIFPDWGVIFISGSISGSFCGFIAFLDVFLVVLLLIYRGSNVVTMRISYSGVFYVNFLFNVPFQKYSEGLCMT